MLCITHSRLSKTPRFLSQYQVSLLMTAVLNPKVTLKTLRKSLLPQSAHFRLFLFPILGSPPLSISLKGTKPLPNPADCSRGSFRFCDSYLHQQNECLCGQQKTLPLRKGEKWEIAFHGLICIQNKQVFIWTLILFANNHAWGIPLGNSG